MKNSARTVSFIVVASASIAARANITAYTDQCLAQTTQFYFDPNTNLGYDPHYSQMSGVPLIYKDPFSNNSVGDASFATQSSISSSELTSTPQYLDVFASVIARASAQADTSYAESTVLTYNYVTFTLDHAGSVTLSANGGGGFSGFGGCFSYLDVDGTDYQTAAVSGSYFIPVSAGTHTAYFEGIIDAYAGLSGVYGGFSGGTLISTYEMQISSVPEPASIACLSAFTVGLIRRRRR